MKYFSEINVTVPSEALQRLDGDGETVNIFLSEEWTLLSCGSIASQNQMELESSENESCFSSCEMQDGRSRCVEEEAADFTEAFMKSHERGQSKNDPKSSFHHKLPCIKEESAAAVSDEARTKCPQVGHAKVGGSDGRDE
jgi:hypothetical protein